MLLGCGGYLDALRLQLFGDRADLVLDAVVGDDVQAIAEERDAPAVGSLLEEVGGALRLIDAELDEMAALLGFHSARGSLGNEFSRHHESQPIALLGFFQVMRGHQNRGAQVSQLVDHAPESAAGQRIDAGGRLVEKEHGRLVHDRGAEGHALFPAAGQAAGELVLLALESRERHHPLLHLVAFPLVDAVHSREEVEILVDREIVVEREFLRHVADALAYGLSAHAAALAGEFHLARGDVEQAAEHLDGGGLASSIGAQEPVDLSVADLNIHVMDGGERAEAFGQILRADGDPAAQVLVRMITGKLGRLRIVTRGAEGFDESVFERRIVFADLAGGQVGFGKRFLDDGTAALRIASHNIQAIAEALHVGDDVARGLFQCDLNFAQILGVHLQALGIKAGAQFGRCAGFANLAEMHEGNAMASLGFIQIGSGDDNGQAFGGKMGERIPELAAGYRVDAGGGFVEQQHFGFRHQRTGQREFLFHAAAEASGKAIGEAIHVEHAQIVHAALADLLRRDQAQVADIADILVDREVGIQTVALRKIARMGTRLPGGLAEYVGGTGGGFHDASEDLERGSLPCPVGSDETEDLAFADFKVDAAHGFNGTVTFAELVHAHGGTPECLAAATPPVTGTAVIWREDLPARCRRTPGFLHPRACPASQGRNRS